MNKLLECLLVGAALIIGALVVALRIRGGQLHRAQVELLKFTIETSMEQDSKIIQSAKERFSKALDAYKEAKRVNKVD